MSLPARPSQASGTVFLTLCCAHRSRRFQVERAAEMFCELLQWQRAEGIYLLHAFVAMPDHAHLLVTPSHDVADAVKRIKGAYSRQWREGRQHDRELWQAGYTAHAVPHREAFISRRVYIEQNPVRAGLSWTPKEFRFSSASGLWDLDAWSE